MEIEASVAAALGASDNTSFPLVEMYLDTGTVYLAGWHTDVQWNGNTYLAFAGVGVIEPVKESASSQNGLTFSMPLVSDAAVVNVLTTELQNRQVLIRLAVVTPTGINASTVLWKGTLDAARMQYGSEADAVQVTAEHDMTRWAKPTNERMNDESHRAKYPDDRFFDHAAQYEDARINWPGKEFYRV